MDKATNMVRKECRKINFSIWLFVLGNIFFLTISAFFTWYGCVCVHKFFTQWHLHSWEKWSVLIGLGGIVLFFQIISSLFQKGNIPKKYTQIDNKSHPSLFVIIDEIKNKLGLSKNFRVFLTDNVSASIFVLPDIQNMVRMPERFVAIGAPLIKNMTEEELKAVLFHEFAHITQSEISQTARASSIGLFAQSFLSERIEYNSKYGPGNLTLSLMVFYYQYIDFLCRYIKKHYELLADELEYRADSVAIQYIEPETLANALLHIVQMSGETDIPTSIKKRIERMGIALTIQKEKEQAKSNKSKILIHLPHRKHFIPWVDHQYSILLKGKDIGEGNLIKGFTIEKDVLPDVYTIEFSSHISTLESKPYTFETDAGSVYHIELDYKYNFRKMSYTIFCQHMKIYSL